MPEEQQNPPQQMKSYRSKEDMPYSPPQELLIRILERSYIPDMICHIMNGEILTKIYTAADGSIQGQWEQKGKPYMNQEGIKSIVTIINNYVSPDMIATNITAQEARMITYHISIEILRDFAVNWTRYGCEESKRGAIVNMIADKIFLNLTSSRDATFINLVKPTFKREETGTYQQEKGKGIYIPLPV